MLIAAVLLTAQPDGRRHAPPRAPQGIAGDVAAEPPEATHEADLSIDVNAPAIQLQHDVVPNLARLPDTVSVSSGSWFDPAIWLNAAVPRAGEVVQIGRGTVVTYDGVSNEAIKTVGVCPGARLEFANDVSTKLVVGTLLVFQGGHLRIGSREKPVAAEATAEIVFADLAPDLAIDPKQYATSLLGFGKVEICGWPKSRTWLRLAKEVRQGDRELQLEEEVTGWRPSETIILPDTRQVPPTQIKQFERRSKEGTQPEWEELVIARVEGTRLILKRPAKFDHRSMQSADGKVVLRPHVAVLDRNVIFRSANPRGTRGHVLFGDRADVRIGFARFRDLGRTDALRPLDNTKVDPRGTATHIGTNHIGRYALHMHHVMGPPNPTNEGYQFELVGNTVDHALKWGYTVHGSHFGLIQDNVGYAIQGSAFTTEDGSETANEFIRNFAMRTQGTGSDGKSGVKHGDFGRGGVGFWFRRTGSIVRDNVAANSSYGGYVVTSYYLDDVKTPRFRGAHPQMAGQAVKRSSSPPGVFEDNEAYGLTRFGYWSAWPSGMELDEMRETLRIGGFRAWGIHHHAIDTYHTNRVLVDGAVILGDAGVLAPDDRERPTIGMNFAGYENDNLVIRNSHVEGMKFGICTTGKDAGGLERGRPMLIENVRLRNYVNIEIGSAAGARGKGVDIRNVRFDRLDVAGLDEPPRPYHIYMRYRLNQSHLLAPDIVRVFDYNGRAGEDFRIFYPEQHADFVVPESGRKLVAAPATGLTNRQLWQQYRVAIGGAVAPADATDGSSGGAYAEIYGLVSPLGGAASSSQVAEEPESRAGG